MIKFGTNKRKDLNIGEIYVAEEPVVVWTVLGSCVAIVFYSKQKKTAAICHAQLPEEKNTGFKCSDACPVKCLTHVPDSNRFKYVTCSIRYMLEAFGKLGIKKSEIIVKLFGGANVLPSSPSTKTIGEQNVETALDVIEHYQLKLVSQNTGGKQGRTLFFDTETGNVFLKHHKPVY